MQQRPKLLDCRAVLAAVKAWPIELDGNLGGTILFHEIGLIEQPNKTLRRSSRLELLVRA